MDINVAAGRAIHIADADDFKQVGATPDWESAKHMVAVFEKANIKHDKKKGKMVQPAIVKRKYCNPCA